MPVDIDKSVCPLNGSTILSFSTEMKAATSFSSLAILDPFVRVILKCTVGADKILILRLLYMNH